jgi:RimJ/RimL family protein N-acetyltransferase
MTIKELDTDRLRLRAWRETDLAPFAALNADPAVMEFMPGLLSQADSDAMVGRICTRFAEQGWGLWAVGLKQGDPFIGFIGLSEPRFEAPFTPCVEIGWRLARPFWGRGYASEGARAALDFAFGTLKLAEVLSFTAAQNQRSRAVMERIGMVGYPAEDFDHPSLAPGHPLRRHVLYRSTRTGQRCEFRQDVAPFM